jgi:hypothetical protein
LIIWLKLRSKWKVMKCKKVKIFGNSLPPPKILPKVFPKALFLDDKMQLLIFCRFQYQSVILYLNDEQKAAAERSLEEQKV